MSSPLPPPPPPPQPPKPAPKPIWKRWWFLAIVVIVLLIAAGAGSDLGDTDGAASTPTTVAEPTTDVTTPPTPPAPSVANVPDVEGEDQSDAVGALEAAGFTVVVETRLTDAQPRGTVLRQSLRGGTEAELGSTITLLVAKPLPVIPNVVGDKLRAARRTLERRGFEVDVRKEGSSQPKYTVIRQSPEGGTSARPGRVVALVVAKPALSGGNGVNCTPGYSPCLPLGPSDYDCSGGSGNGPAYTEPGVTYRVTGSDPYDLDSDNDGSGCE